MVCVFFGAENLYNIHWLHLSNSSAFTSPSQCNFIIIILVVAFPIEPCNQSFIHGVEYCIS